MADFYQNTFIRILQPFKHGRMILTLPDGGQHVFGKDDEATPIQMRVRKASFFRHCILHGEIGFGDGYVDGEWETNDLTGLIQWMLKNVECLPGAARNMSSTSVAWNLLRGFHRLGHVWRSNTRRNSRKNIAAHYDLSNAFYRLWLDKTLTYSSAYFEAPQSALDAAQIHKYQKLADHVGIQQGHHVLEIGCGWGGFALFAARKYDCKVTGITLSKEQLTLARERVRQEGMQEQIEFKLMDYRDVDGQYDRIVSIEMLEAVGHRFLPTFFGQIGRTLKPNGLVGLQVIISPDSTYQHGRKKVDWIQKHIFPGGHLPSIGAINDAANRTTDLTLQHLENFGLHYAQTLHRWYDSFNTKLDDVRLLGFDGNFIRKWNYYLNYCEAAFAMRNINVCQMAYARPNNVSYVAPSERIIW